MMLFVCFILIISTFALTLRAGRAFACMTVIAGKDASATGEVLVGHNEDSDGRYVMRSYIVPPASSASAPTMRFEPSSATIDMPSERAGLFWSEARTYYPDGSSFCDFYINTNGVVICSDSCGVSKEDKPDITDGGVGYGLRRVVAESARSAWNAVEIATKSIDRYGYIGNGRSYHFADKNEAWVLQVVKGKRYAVKRVPDDEVYLIPNYFTIHRPGDETPHLKDLTAYAVKRGWCDDADDFDFARAYQAPESCRAKNSIHRHIRGLEIISGRQFAPDSELPFSIKPPRKIGVDDIKRTLRTHYEGTADYLPQPYTPHTMETRPICDQSTLESNIVQIRNNPAEILIWRALGKPCLSPYIPWYLGLEKTPDAFGQYDHEQALHSHFSAPASDFDYMNGGLWRHYTDLQMATDLLYATAADGVRREITEFERTLESRAADFERSGAGRNYDGFVNEIASDTLTLLKDLYAKFDVAEMSVTEKGDPEATLVATINTLHHENSEIAPEKILLGPSYIFLSKWARARHVKRSETALEIEFAIPEDWKEFLVPCQTDVWAVLENEKGERMIARAVVSLNGRRL